MPDSSGRHSALDGYQPRIEETRIEVERLLAESTGRVIIGVVGAPGAGKSTFAEALAVQLGAGRTAVVPMDGFHLANAVLDGTPLRARKGAIDTFDIGGYLSLLRRLRAGDEATVYAPTYRRGLEEPIAASIAVSRDIPIVVTEGNYLLADRGEWVGVRDLLDAAWFIRVPDLVRLDRLVRRHVSFGMTDAEARAWAGGTDQVNADLVEATAFRADHVLDWV